MAILYVSIGTVYLLVGFGYNLNLPRVQNARTIGAPIGEALCIVLWPIIFAIRLLTKLSR